MIIREVALAEVLPIRRDVMYPGKSLQDVELPDDARGTHLGLFDSNDQLVTVVSVFIDNKDLQFRKFATLVNEQGKGYGKQMLAYILGYSRAKNIERVWCNSRQDALRLYKRFGFQETTERFTRGGIDFVIAELFL